MPQVPSREVGPTLGGSDPVGLECGQTTQVCKGSPSPGCVRWADLVLQWRVQEVFLKQSHLSTMGSD